MTAAERADQYAITKNRYFFGIGDCLGFLLASLTADAFSASLDSEDFEDIAFTTSFGLLAGHSSRTEFSEWLERGEVNRWTFDNDSIGSKSGLIHYLGQSESWDFWLRWYQGIWDGQPLDWGLTRAVALIEDEVWQAGPEAVAEAIREIEARFALNGAIETAETELARGYAQRHGIGGNNPPEAIDAYDPLPKALQIIWEPFDELRSEAEKAAPDRTKIQAAIQKLSALLLTCGGWLADKLDVAATEYAKAIGKFAGPATVVWLASHVPAIRSVFEAAKTWLLTLVG